MLDGRMTPHPTPPLSHFPLDRMESVWTNIAVIGALMSTMTFLAYQKGLNSDLVNINVDPSEETLTAYVVLMAVSLSFNTVATFTATLYLFMMAFLPKGYVSAVGWNLNGCLKVFVILSVRDIEWASFTDVFLYHPFSDIFVPSFAC